MTLLEADACVNIYRAEELQSRCAPHASAAAPGRTGRGTDRRGGGRQSRVERLTRLHAAFPGITRLRASTLHHVHIRRLLLLPIIYRLDTSLNIKIVCTTCTWYFMHSVASRDSTFSPNSLCNVSL